MVDKTSTAIVQIKVQSIHIKKIINSDSDVNCYKCHFKNIDFVYKHSFHPIITVIIIYEYCILWTFNF